MLRAPFSSRILNSVAQSVPRSWPSAVWITDQPPLHRTEHVVGGNAAVVEEELAELALAGELAGRDDREARRGIGSSRHESPLCFGACGSVRASSRHHLARWARLDHTFCP